MRRLKIFYLILVISLVACSNEEEKTGKGTEQYDVSLQLEQNSFPYENWKVDSTHLKLVKGNLFVGDKPVVGAEMQISNKRKTVTDANGTFSILLDANMIDREIVHVSSLNDATVDNKELSEQMKKDLLGVKQELTVYFPIEIERVEEDQTNSSLLKVHGHAVLKEGEEFPKFGVEKFPIIGSIIDGNGNPVEGATVNIRRDGVEGFSMSDPSNENGEYSMYYIPEDDENHYLNVYLPSKGVTYTLPEGKAFLFPDDFGIKLDIVLPEDGTIIHDEPPTLVATSAKGALYKGVLIGLNTFDDYFITVPKRDGSFVVTVPKAVWETKPSFYQINYRGYSEIDLNLGDTLSAKDIPFPGEHEPNQISAEQK